VPIFLTLLQAKRTLKFLEDFDTEFRHYFPSKSGAVTTIILHFRDGIEKGEEWVTYLDNIGWFLDNK
jgi:hypothetical protein